MIDRTCRLSIRLVAVALLAVACSNAGSTDSAVFGVHDAWTRPSAAAQTTAALYLTIDAGPEPDTLMDVAVDPSVAASASVHETSAGSGGDNHDGHVGHESSDEMVTMEMLDSLPIDAGATVTLQPGGLHIMLNELRKPLRQGERFDIELHFADAGAIVVTVEVADR